MTEKLKYVSLRFQTQVIDEIYTMGSVSDYAYVYIVTEDGKKYFGEKPNHSKYNYILYSIECDDIPSTLTDITILENVGYEEILKRNNEKVFFTYIDGDMRPYRFENINREATLKVGVAHGNVKEDVVTIVERMDISETFDIFAEYFED